MPFSFKLSPTRNRPIAPSIRIDSSGQIHITLSKYAPKSGPKTDFFETGLYEGIATQYKRLGLQELPSSPEARVWQGIYNADIRRYLAGLVKGKQNLPPLSLNQETHHAGKPSPQADPPNLFSDLSATNAGATRSRTASGSQTAGDRGSDSRATGRIDESGQPTLFSAGSGTSRGRDIEGTPSRTEGRGNGQLNIFSTPEPSLFSPAAEQEESKATASPSPTPPASAVNHRINPDEQIAGIGAKTRLRHIIAAVKTLKTLEAEDRVATPEEQKILAGFSGFGSVANVAFLQQDGTFRDGYEELGQELEALLTREELHSARRSTPNAFYTSPTVMNAMFEAMDKLGVSGESIHALEPGSGIGNFIGISPENYQFTGVEKESLSARIAAKLYPGHPIIHKDFKDTETILPGDGQPLLQDGAFDVVVGNIPFGRIQLPHSDGKSYKIHDYFLLKSLDKLREGGVMAVVTSAFTMDKVDASIREQLGEQADLVAAYRLPNQAFSGQGTEVLTDILILQKCSPEQAPSNPEWFQTQKVMLDTDGQLVPSEEGISINQYFLDHPAHILGDHLRIEKKMYGRESLQVSLEDPASLGQRLKAQIDTLPSEIYSPRPEQTPAPLKEVFTQELEESSEHIREGSFVLKGKEVHQVQYGELTPVIQRGKTLTTDGKTGKRIRDYIAVRDAVKQVIEAQKNQAAPALRDQARTALSGAYDRFLKNHGPINAVNVFEREDPKRLGETRITRRFVNVNDLRGDPDIYLVMSIEKYDEKTNQAEKGDIFSKDIIAPKREVIAETPEEALIASMQQYGTVDTAYMADSCAMAEDELIEALQTRESPLIFFDPALNSYTTREDYLSGNIREKLKALKHFDDEPSRIAPNQVVLEAVLPKPIPYEAVTANLGAGWIEPHYVQQFAEEHFGGEWDVQFVRKNAQWLAEPSTRSFSRGGDSFGTERLSGDKLFILTLEGKGAKVYKTVSDGDGGEKRVLDREQTLLARQAQEKIRQRFKQWAFEDETRAEYLAQRYNETFNSVVLRQYDGQFLTFDGMNAGIKLRPHQKDAVYRTLCDESCLLAHATGAGKTFSMAAAGMNLKRMGLRHKPLYVVPNHMLEQFSREFLMLYPDADILVATKKDLQKEQRKLFTAKAATGDWDAIIMTHSSFNKVGMSPDYQQAFIEKEIESYEELLRFASNKGGNNRRFIKDLETSKQNLENKLDNLVGKNARSKDQHIFFEELGVDHIFIDEAHAFKNLQIQTKMDRVAGLNTTGSERSLNLFMMTEYLNDQDQAGITFATATPITNSLSEMYTMMRYLIPQQMDEIGIQHFDAWAAAFGEVVTRLEIKPDASTIDFQSRFAKFHNVPELLQLFNLVADVKRPEDLDLPVPKAKYETVVAEPSDDLLDFQYRLHERYQRVRNGSVEPKEDNALKISTEGRKAALDVRLVDSMAPDDPGSKVNLLVDKAFHVWENNQDSKATQMIFCDMGVNAKEDSPSIYEDILDKLVGRGIPREEVANINDYNTDVKKAAMFEKMRRGEVRVLIGSTQKMGTGTNVQKGTEIKGKLQGGLIALHHLDAPWRPADMEQRDGRIIRQGNPFPEVDIYRYITKQSFDAVMWQKLEQKQHFISQIMTNSLTDRVIDDVGSEEALAFAEVAAVASGNPEILELAEVEAEIRALGMQEEAYNQKITRARREQQAIPGRLGRYQRNAEILANFIDQRDLYPKTLPQLVIGQRQPGERKEANTLLKSDLSRMYTFQTKRLATVQGLDIFVERFGENQFRFQIANEDVASLHLNREETLKDSTDLVRRLDNLVTGLEKKQAALQEKVQETEQAASKVASFLKGHEVRVAASPYDSGFDEMARLVQLKEDKTRLESLLATSDAPDELEEELLDAEVEEAVIVGESKSLERVI